jgi:DNA helicase-2/ATP-dependent DNA helicase PcrA
MVYINSYCNREEVTDVELTSQSAFEEELQQLKTTLTLVDDLKKRYESIPRYHGYELEEQALELQRTIMRQKLSIAAKEPYFGRLDFQESGAASPVPLYIGKVGIEDEAANQPIVIDWRAPIASLFYSFNGGTIRPFIFLPMAKYKGLFT